MPFNASDPAMGQPSQPMLPAAALAQSLFQRLTGRTIEMATLDPVAVEIHVTGAPEHESDGGVAGVYLVEIDPDLPAEDVARTAFVAFHSTVTIARAQAFHCVVVMKGVVIGESPGHHAGETTRRAVVLGKMSD